MNHKILYSRTSTGAVQTWRMEHDGNGKFRTITGQLDGKLITSDWTIAKGKNIGKANETSPKDQALKEIAAKYKKQLKTGYFENVEDIDKETYVQCMLAAKYKDRAHEVSFSSGQWLLQCKLNGGRCLATKSGLFTRKGEKWMCAPHISKSLEPFFKKHPKAVLDGEFYSFKLRQKLNELMEIIRKTVNITEEDLRKSEEVVRFCVYDGYGFDGLDESVSYGIRQEWINKNIVGHYDYIEEVPSEVIVSQAQFEKSYQRLLEDGQEGGILRKIHSPYEHKRSKYLLKVKTTDDDEAIIRDIKEGEGNWSGKAKVITLEWEGKVFDASFKGSMKQAEDFLKNREKYLDCEVTFLYDGLTGKGTPNFARIDINNCFKK